MPFRLTYMRKNVPFRITNLPDGIPVNIKAAAVPGVFCTTTDTPTLGIFLSIYSLVTEGHTVYFSADNRGHEREFWKSGGTVSEREISKNLRQGAYPGSTPEQITLANGTLFFVSDDGISGRDLWESNGTGTVTFRVKDIRAASGRRNRDLIKVKERQSAKDDRAFTKKLAQALRVD
jgi:ELWxxDGT repeat protein